MATPRASSQSAAAAAANANASPNVIDPDGLHFLERSVQARHGGGQPL